MGSLLKNSYTIDLPPGALVKNNAVTWETKGKKKTGTLSKGGKVLCQSDVWIAQFVDEEGKLKRVSTKTKDRAAANRVLVRLENEVSLVRNGVTSRADLTRASTANTPTAEFLEKYKTKMIAEGTTGKHIKGSFQRIEELIGFCKAESLSGITRLKIESWIAKEVRSGVRSNRTINAYVIALKSFTKWCRENDFITSDPLVLIKNLNESVNKRKDRRSLSEEEIKRLFAATHERKYRKCNKAEEHELIYRLLIGTGLRSKELGLSTPSQFDFEKNRFRVKAEKTKNRKDDVLPLRPDLVARLKSWVETHKVGTGDRIFKYSVASLRHSFIRDCKAAGIELKSPDGRSIDVHSLRRTFGTMLARAGVPLTTTQRLMRHSTPELTAKLYIDVEPIDMQQAVDKLPAF